MYECVISYYARISALQRLILIGNVCKFIYCLIEESFMFKDPLGYLSLTHHFENFAKISTAIPLPEFEPCPYAFHETAICFIEEENEFD